jgi:capsular polysaccharide biosynthesis protein
MTEMNKLYVKNLFQDLWRHRLFTGFCVLACAALLAFAGYSKVTDDKELEEYNTRLEEYDQVLADVENSLALAVEQVEDMQKYVDESIYMRLDGQNIQAASVQYAAATEANLGNIFNALIYYINEGGLRESFGDEYQDLDVKYWRDVVTCATGGNVFSVTVMHYDQEKAKQILDLVKQRIQEQIPVISEAQGAFTLREISTSYYVKADVGITNNQNNHRNTLKNYISNRADFTNKLISNQNGKASYIENNMPVLLGSDPSGSMVTILFYLIIGVVLGFGIPVGCFALRNVLHKRIRSEEDLKTFGLHTIGCCHTQAELEGALSRGLVELKYFVKDRSLPAVFFNILSEDDVVEKVVSGYEALLGNHQIPLKTGKQLQKEAAELQEMMDAGACVLVVKTGKTTYPQIERQMELCSTFHVDILGCVVVG